jgi:hypothetical protein
MKEDRRTKKSNDIMIDCHMMDNYLLKYSESGELLQSRDILLQLNFWN